MAGNQDPNKNNEEKNTITHILNYARNKKVINHIFKKNPTSIKSK